MISGYLGYKITKEFQEGSEDVEIKFDYFYYAHCLFCVLSIFSISYKAQWWDLLQCLKPK